MRIRLRSRRVRRVFVNAAGIVAAFAAPSASLKAQTVRTVDLSTAQFDSVLPFHRTFRLRVSAPEAVKQVSLSYYPSAEGVCRGVGR